MSHAILAPSAADRWTRCPGSAALALQYTDPPSPYAAEGTAAHSLAAEMLQGNGSVEAWQGSTIEQHTVDAEMVEAVSRYVSAIRQAAEGAAELWIEEPLDLSEWIPESFGTADAIIIDDLAGEAQIHDLKYGKGVEVSAVDNPQMKLYALGVLTLAHLIGYEIDTVRFAIHQPRREHYSEDTETANTLIEWAREILPSARLALQLVHREMEGGAPSADIYQNAHPGEVQCRFCPAKGDCRALAESVQHAVAGELFSSAPPDPEAPADPARISCAELANLLPQLGYVEDWVTAVRQRATRELQAGNKVPGYKLVTGKRGPRQWTDTKAAESLLLEQFRLPKKKVYTQKLASPAQIEKLLGDKRQRQLAPYIRETGGTPAVAPESDTRSEITTTATFDELDDPQE